MSSSWVALWDWWIRENKSPLMAQDCNALPLYSASWALIHRMNDGVVISMQLAALEEGG